LASFKEIINSDKPVLVDFSAEWCGPCKMMVPILKDVANAMGDSSRILKVDIDRNPEVAKKYDIMGVPTIIIFVNGSPSWRRSGVVQTAELVSVLRSLINK
jgi:thioredoxin 1